MVLYIRIFLFFLISWAFGSFCYNAGANSVQRKFDLYKIEELKRIEEQLIKNDNQKKLIDGLIRKIEEQNEQHKKDIDETKAAASIDLADRLRREKSRSNKCPVPNPSSSSNGLDESRTSASVIFPESVARRLEGRHEYADKLTESLRACRAYITLIGKSKI